jgi:pimeloyl-ACP methyl ester carboxylesterase
MAQETPIILLSGMAADERLFEAQRDVFPQMTVPRWIEPRARESLQNYAERLAKIVDPGCPCIVGGASFGGIVALEMARFLSVRACLLFGSVRSPAELPWWVPVIRPLSLFGPERLRIASGLLARSSASSLPRSQTRAMRKLTQPEHRFLLWASWAVLRWWPEPGRCRFPIFQIHGAGDRTLPARRSRADVIVPDAGHLLTLTHPQVVNDFVQNALRKLAS